MTKIFKPPFKVQGVKWTDSAGLGVWSDQQEMASLVPLEILSVGWLIAEDKDSMTLVQSYDTRDDSWQGDNLICIPRVAILDTFEV